MIINNHISRTTPVALQTTAPMLNPHAAWNLPPSLPAPLWPQPPSHKARSAVALGRVVPLGSDHAGDGVQEEAVGGVLGPFGGDVGVEHVVEVVKVGLRY